MARPDGNDESLGMVFGFHVVLESLQTQSRSIQRIWTLRTDGRFFRIAQLAKEQRIPLSVESRERLDRRAGNRHHQGVVAQVAAKSYLTGDELLDSLDFRLDSPLIVVLDQIQDPHNLGAIVRSVEASGGHGIVIPKHRAVGLTGGVVKASAGALEHVPIARVTNTGKFLETCQEQDLFTIAMDEEGTQVYSDIDLTAPVALVFGSEGEGIRPLVLKKCDMRARIPMVGRMNSLNVSVAVAVVLFEARRQRDHQR